MKGDKHEFFPSKLGSTRTKEGTMLVLPGLLGEMTMVDSVVQPLTQDGFNVMMVGHSRRNRRLHTCNKDRSIDFHLAAKAAVIETKGDSTVHILAHSMGGFDAVNGMKHSLTKEEVPYKVYGYGAIAAVGRNGFRPMPWDVVGEFWSHRNEVRENLNNEIMVLRKSLGSAMRNPILAFFEAISAVRADIDQATLLLQQEGVFRIGYEVYGDQDRLVPQPRDRVVEVYEGHHMTPVYRPDVAIETARFITNSQKLAA